MSFYYLSIFQAILLFAVVGCQANFLMGDFVPTARKTQFHGQRSQWHDVLGSHCPKFGINRMVVLPLPQPVGFATANDYKLQFNFDGDRVTTQWVQVLGRAPTAPYLRVELVRSGDALVSASARIEKLAPSDPHYSKIHAEFSRPDVWPKHLPVYYSWTVRHEVDVDRGLLVLFGAGAAAMFMVALSVVRAYKKQLQQFVDDVTGESPFGAGPAGVNGPKAD